MKLVSAHDSHVAIQNYKVHLWGWVNSDHPDPHLEIILKCHDFSGRPNMSMRFACVFIMMVLASSYRYLLLQIVCHKILTQRGAQHRRPSIILPFGNLGRRPSEGNNNS